ncbi:reverse transcriptase Ty1/copia-type domain-containing protein [Citrus sinensis]|uniref:Reverse transcriptase Ty1/copia-type domain-containing protein n=1 Tax=Citrus sinensis TaxID=2711 RepID=A0ACB8MK73_CITSI|nr:reverse transcriptase Ty1/copia-type domain-containing protein [Citrus sinensis]
MGCKWVFMVKRKADGSIGRFKARLADKVFTQTYGIDYQETSTPVAKMNSIWVLLSLAANLEWPLQQLDVKSAFLHGDLEEEAYMNPPPGFENTFERGRVCKLKKSLYELKQSPRAWFDRFARFILKCGHQQSHSDHMMFLKHGKEDKLAILIVYVNDIILIGNDRDEIEDLRGVVSQFMHSPNVEHMEVVFRILKYLKTSPGKGILFSKNNHLWVEAYTDADWAGSFADRKSASDYCTFVRGNLVTRKS